MDTTTLLMVMAMSGGGGMRNMLPLLLLTGGLGGTGTTDTTGLMSTNSLVGAMMPGGALLKYLVGGIGAVAMSGMMKPKRRRRTRVVYRNRYYRSRRRY